MRLALIVPVALTIGLLYGCETPQGGSTATSMGESHGSQGASGYGNVPVYDERQRDPAYQGQRSEALEGNTR